MGIAQVRSVFKSSRYGIIAGCMVLKGIIKRNNSIRVLRNNEIIYTGNLDSLKHFKEDVSDVNKGTECGISVKNFDNIKIGDHFEVFTTTKIKKETINYGDK